MRDGQNVIVSNGTNGNLATTSYGPRTTTASAPGYRPMSFVRRELVLQLDGDKTPTLVADFENNTLFALPTGSLVTDVIAYSDTGAVISLTFTDEDLNVTTAIALTPAAKEWDVETGVNHMTKANTQITGTIAAGDTATVLIAFMQAEPPGANGVLKQVV